MTAIAKQTDQIALSYERLQEATNKPFLCLPKNVRAKAFSLWVVMQYAFRTPFDLTGPIAIDLGKGLTEEDAIAILDDMSDPEERVKIKAAWDFGPEWSRRAAAAMKRRRQIEASKEAAVIDPSQQQNFANMVQELSKRISITGSNSGSI